MPHPLTGEVELIVTADTTVTAEVVNSVLNPIDGQYHYNLTASFTDGNNAATVSVKDVIQSLIIEKE